MVNHQHFAAQFVRQYYQMFQQQRELVHQFYNNSSSMLRTDGEQVTHFASDFMDIDKTIMSLNITGMDIEIKSVNSLESWKQGLIVFVSGSAKSKSLSLSRSRKFVQTFFLAPVGKDYFVLNDVFHLVDEEVEQPYSAPVVQDSHVDYQPTLSTHIPVSNYQLEEGARAYVNSTHISDRGEPVQAYQHKYDAEPKPDLVAAEPESRPEPEDDIVEGGTHLDDSSVFPHSSASTLQEPQPSVEAEQPSQEPEKLTYASILRAPPSVSSAIVTREPLPAADWNQQPQPFPVQPTPSPIKSGADTVEESSSFEEGTTRTVYIKNLPSVVTKQDIFKEFKTFGEIKPDGVFLNESYYALVEYKDVESARKAVQASPIRLSGREVFIEKKRQNTGAFRGGMGGGRGRGGGRDRSFGRGK